jgi:Prokaryotic homologs of the JAB domain
MSTFAIVCLEEHEASLHASLFARPGAEGAAYVLFKEARIESDPWDRTAHTKHLVREVVTIHPVSADAMHVTWDTRSYVELLQRAQRDGLVLGIAHSHPCGPDNFSSQDDENEAELLRTACNRNGKAAKLVSMLFTPDHGIRARVWQYPKYQTTARSVTVIGERLRLHLPDQQSPASPAFARQVLAFGPSLMHQLKNLRVGIIGTGGTGSATAPLVARAGAGQ